jgi:outer membrane protein
MSCYFDVLYYLGMVDIAKQRLEASQRSLELVRVQFELGQRSRADMHEVEATVASNESTLISQQNSLEMSYISLRSAMNYTGEKPLEIDPEIGIESIVSCPSLDGVLDYALENHYTVRNADRSVRSSEISLSNAKWQMAPSLSSGISFSYGTSYYARMGKLAVPVDDWATQMKGNRGSGLSLGSISIPIFSGFSRRNNKIRAQNNLRNAEINAENARRSLQTDITRAYQQMQGYGAQYIANRKRVETARVAYQGMEQKFEQGMVSPLDLQSSANTLLQAEADMLRTRLSYIIQCRIVDYYNGVSFIESAARKN